ncbi:LysR family transcriptional regulator [Williamsia sterculiae]|uniref:DNA-binding transcriptional regulator, LysR family n=1 Tax=Williamsia sterculiae TaxID=1344003 RepID=A0A1N7F238_9NOCA|nr:LysR family transcriptional regulator [Williamsia sterculiae]SIR94379.1 DNA-binding transcriptional regulator, LysR family [Williamsia sterculiae]
MIDIHRLRVFRAVIADGSIAGAAVGLGYTASAVSQHMAALQRETGLTLVERRGRGLVPTDTGRILADRSATVFHSIAEVDSLVADLRSGRTGNLSIEYFSSAGAAWIPPVIAVLTREFPDVRMDLRLFELREDSTAADIEIFVARTSDDEPGTIRLLDEPYLAVVPADSEYAARAAIPLSDLRDAVWVDNDAARGPCRENVLAACATVGFSPSFRVQTYDYPTAVRFVAEGVGVTVIPRLGLGQLPPSVRAVPLVDPTPMRHVALRVSDRCPDNPTVIRAVELLRARAAA